MMQKHIERSLYLLIFYTTTLYAQEVGHPLVSRVPPDFSGLAWVAADTFLAVHDAKTPIESDLPRISRLVLPGTKGGLLWTALDVEWPDSTAPGSDLESISRIPGTSLFVMAESSDRGLYRRLFLSEYRNGDLAVIQQTEWPEPTTNVEGIAVVGSGDQMYLLYAERAQGLDSTTIAWLPLQIHPFVVRKRAGGLTFSTGIRADSSFRPISDLAVDVAGYLYVASAFDPGVDAGPFGSYIWKVGRWETDEDGISRLRLEERPVDLGVLDGLKVEGLTVRQKQEGDPVLFIGTDDEWMGGIVRQLPSHRSLQTVQKDGHERRTF